MHVYGTSQGTFQFYCIPSDGALIVVQPDEFVGTISFLRDVQGVQKYVATVLSAL